MNLVPGPCEGANALNWPFLVMEFRWRDRGVCGGSSSLQGMRGAAKRQWQGQREERSHGSTRVFLCEGQPDSLEAAGSRAQRPYPGPQGQAVRSGRKEKQDPGSSKPSTQAHEVGWSARKLRIKGDLLITQGKFHSWALEEGVGWSWYDKVVCTVMNIQGACWLRLR